jgi:hypothetical protein
MDISYYLYFVNNPCTSGTIEDNVLSALLAKGAAVPLSREEQAA